MLDPIPGPAPRRARPSPLLLLLLVAPVVYVATLARTVVYGDPTEYTFVANILGIAHPPGYAFYTLLGKLFQTVMPIGDVPWRMHLLAAASATAAALFLFGATRAAAGALFAGRRDSRALDTGLAAGLFAALSFGLAANVWQHAIHANPHIVTAAFLAANLFFLTRWAAGGATDRRWLYAFALSAGLGVTHHPLTIISWPAYAVFLLLARPGLWRDGRALLGMAGCGLLGLAVWLYFPLRSPMAPAFGPSTMNTLNGFLDHVLARGLAESLPYFGLADAPGRLVVFWTLLRLQYSLPVIFLAVLGLVWPLAERRLMPGVAGPGGAARPAVPAWKLTSLYALAFLCNYAFVMSLRAQDVMAYLLGLLVIVALLAGVGLHGLLALAAARLRPAGAAPALLAAALFLLGPGLALARNAPRISLRDYTAAADYVTTVFDRFDGRGEGATLLNDWEHMTPLWYSQFVENRWPAEADVRPVLVSTAQPWLESVFATLPGGPVYLSNYRREIVDAGFRLRPDGPLYQVVEPGQTSVPDGLTPVAAVAGPIEIVGYDLPQREVTAGAYVPLTLAMRVPASTADYFVPVVRVGDLTFTATTDSHLTTPLWEPGEVIVERFDFALPHDLPGGAYRVTLGLKNLSADAETELALPLGELAVTGQNNPPNFSGLLANFRQRVGLVGATARVGAQRRAAVWQEPLAARPGDTVHLLLRWQSLARAEESYTVFVHLIDAANRPLVTLDYTPLGGSTPTHLWIPKWLPGQQLLDPYRLALPADLPPGEYYIEVGLYEMVSKRRLHMADVAGNLIGDRLILGPVRVSNE
ncbi:protein O-mannosyl-transferase family [Promineifilum sp.]|uniref:protein O-mannosyl-transferase family n=1 Tax=Promineifilum sp. TaxID=2664178 RepID=UPI0035AEC438